MDLDLRSLTLQHAHMDKRASQPWHMKNTSIKVLLVPAVWHVNARVIVRASKDPRGIKPAPMAYLNSMKKE